ncbi:MAG: hypothetical protein JNN15_07185 [Blastocatellia bacterium]|nr:hypothetical protein [Blastocatellia bacterium]
MRKLLFYLLFFLSACLLSIDFDSTRAQSSTTVIKDEAAKQMLLGEHRLSLQWVSWDYFGKATVTDKNGQLFIQGEQKSRRGSDYLKIDGQITSVDTKEIKFKGTVLTQVSFLNNGNPCKREGEMTFKITGNRKYWRLQEMNNPCDEAADYVDIYFRQPEDSKSKKLR